MNQELLETSIGGCDVQLGNRYLKKDGDLIVADLHFGKTMHFRKAGLAIPMQARDADQSAFYRLLAQHQPKRMIILGDLFHSEHNSEVEEVAMITSQFPDTEFILVRGNHDVMSESDYRSMDLETCDIMEWHGFILSHEPLEKLGGSALNMHGHLHPGIVLRGRARQSVKIPCFHFDGERLCLPAFGALTGLMKVKPKKGHQIYGIAEGSAFPIDLG